MFWFDWTLYFFVFLRTIVDRRSTSIRLPRLTCFFFVLNRLLGWYLWFRDVNDWLCFSLRWIFYVFGWSQLNSRFLSEILFNLWCLFLSFFSGSKGRLDCSIDLLVSDVFFEVNSGSIDINLKLKFIVFWEVDFELVSGDILLLELIYQLIRIYCVTTNLVVHIVLSLYHF